MNSIQRIVLFIINDAPYGNERPYNALRLALNLLKRSDVSVRVFLTGDVESFAHARDRTLRKVTTILSAW